MKTGIIYGYTNLESGKMYIGQTLHPERRWKAHRYGKYKNGWHIDYQNNPDKYEYSVIEYDVPEDKLDEREIFWISFFDSYHNGYNLTEGGGGIRGCNVSISTREKLSKINKGKPKTLEQRQKMSEAQKGKPKTLEHRQKMSEAKKGSKPWNSGKHWSNEVKQKISDANKGLQTGEKNPMYGKKHSDEAKAKVSKANKGKHWYNNGIKNITAFECPSGYKAGRL